MINDIIYLFIKASIICLTIFGHNMQTKGHIILAIVCYCISLTIIDVFYKRR